MPLLFATPTLDGLALRLPSPSSAAVPAPIEAVHLDGGHHGDTDDDNGDEDGDGTDDDDSHDDDEPSSRPSPSPSPSPSSSPSASSRAGTGTSSGSSVSSSVPIASPTSKHPDDEVTPTTATSAVASATTTTSNVAASAISSGSVSKSMLKGTMAGAVIGGVTALMLLLFAMFVLVRRCRQRRTVRQSIIPYFMSSPSAAAESSTATVNAGSPCRTSAHSVWSSRSETRRLQLDTQLHEVETRIASLRASTIPTGTGTTFSRLSTSTYGASSAAAITDDSRTEAHIAELQKQVMLLKGQRSQLARDPPPPVYREKQDAL